MSIMKVDYGDVGGGASESWTQVILYRQLENVYTVSLEGFTKLDLIIYNGGSVSSYKANMDWSTGTITNQTYIQNNVGNGTYVQDISGDYNVFTLTSNNVSYNSYVKIHLYN